MAERHGSTANGTAANGTPAQRSVLLICDDADVTAACRGVAAAAGVPLVVRPQVPLDDGWDDPVLVLLTDGTGPGPRRRPGVVLVGQVPLPEGLLRQATTQGVEHVVALPDGQAWLARRMVEAFEAAAPAGCVVGVVGGCGGAGASVLAGALVWSADAAGLSSLVVDADTLGGGIDLVLGAESVDGLRWPDLAALRGPVQPGLLPGLLPRVRGIRLLSWGRQPPPGATAPVLAAEAVDAVLASARAHFDLVVVDLPRTLPPGSGARAAAVGCDTVLLVVPARVRSAAAAIAVAAGLRDVAADVRLVLRQARGGLSAAAVCEALDVPLAAVLRPEPGLAAALDRGEPPSLRRTGPLARAAAALLTSVVAERPVRG